MIFGRLPLDEALGAIAAHSLRLFGDTGATEVVFKKGRVLSATDLERLAAAGHTSIIAARLAAGDLLEDDAAARVGKAVAGAGLQVAEATTGRCNLYAAQSGVFRVDAARVDHLNHLDEAVTLATIAPFSPVHAGDLVATVKIIPFAVASATLERCSAAAVGGLCQLAPYRPSSMGLILTRIAGGPERLLDRAAAMQRVRAERLGGRIVREVRCRHDEAEVATALHELLLAGLSPILVLGASAIVDRRDVIPAAVERVGGVIDHFGMPVDPGNLLLLAHVKDAKILGIPGCARSLRRSGFDTVLERLCADITVTAHDLMSMGVGGLLGEIAVRPQPRAESEAPDATQRESPHVGALVLCAGRSSRMGDVNKLLCEVDGAPLVTHAVDALLKTAIRPIVVVIGHEAERVRAALVGREVSFVQNPDYAAGLSTSLRAGLVELQKGPPLAGVLVCLGDMPRVRPAHLEALLGAFDPDDGRAIVAPTYRGQRGNPVLIAARYFAELLQLAGDVGARGLLDRHKAALCCVPMDDDGVTVDVDTKAALLALQKIEPCRT